MPCTDGFHRQTVKPVYHVFQIDVTDRAGSHHTGTYSFLIHIVFLLFSILIKILAPDLGSVNSSAARTKSSTCGTLAPSAVALATNFHFARVRIPQSVLFDREQSFLSNKEPENVSFYQNIFRFFTFDLLFSFFILCCTSAHYFSSLYSW